MSQPNCMTTLRLTPINLALCWAGLAATYSLIPLSSGMSVQFSVLDSAAAMVFWALCGAAVGALATRLRGRWIDEHPVFAWTIAVAAWAGPEAVFTTLVVIKPTRWPPLAYSAITIVLPAVLAFACAIWGLRRASRERCVGRWHPALIIVVCWTTVAALTHWSPRWVRAFLDAPDVGWVLWGGLDLLWLSTGIASVACVGALLFTTRRLLAGVIGGALTALQFAPPLLDREESPASSSISAPPDIVWVVIDAVRADHVGAYGYPRATTPTFDRLTSRGTLVRNHISAGARTENTYAKMLTLDDALAAYVRAVPTPLTAFRSLLPATFLREQPGVISSLRRAGYETVLFHAYHDLLEDRGMQPWLQSFEQSYRTRRSGDASLGAYVARMFITEHIDGVPRMDRWAAFRRRYVAEIIDDDLRTYLRDRDSSRPMFLVVHLAGGHVPYYRFREEHRITMPPAVSRVVGAYDEALRSADDQLGEIVTALDEELKDPTIFVFADHGAVLEGTPRLPQFVNVPLLVMPALSSGPTQVTSSQDIVATTLDLALRREPTCNSSLGHNLACPPSVGLRVVNHTGRGRLVLASFANGVLIAAELANDLLVGASDGRAVAGCDTLRTLTNGQTEIVASPLEVNEAFNARIEQHRRRCQFDEATVPRPERGF